jgi:Flp pilus assembly protein TadD
MKTLIRIILAFLAVFALVACNKGKDEPRVVCTQEDGQQTTEIVAVEVDESCEVMDHKDIPAEAATLHERARREGQQGNYKAALSLLEQAAELAPRWAYPHYDMAFTYH